MGETLTLLSLIWMAGGVLGAIFFGGLWWTTRRGIVSERPALWFLGSFVVRMSVVLAGFYFSAGGSWERLLLCLLGFVMARAVVTRVTRPPSPALPTFQTPAALDARHAPQS